MDWNYFKIRRNVTLKSFVEGAQNEGEALQRFTARRLTGIPHEEITELFAKKSTPAAEVSHVLTEPEENVPSTKAQIGKKSVKNETVYVPE
jgi:hypothetical protein